MAEMDPLENSLDDLLLELDMLEQSTAQMEDDPPQSTPMQNNNRSSFPMGASDSSVLATPPPQTPPNEAEPLTPLMQNNSRSRGPSRPKSVRVRAPTLTMPETGNNSRSRATSRSVVMQKPPESNGAVCAHCKEPITGEYTLALGQMYHRHHLKCNRCNIDLNDEFYQLGNRNLCLNCGPMVAEGSADHVPPAASSESKNRRKSRSVYFDKPPMIQQNCPKCKQPVAGEYVDALDQFWHPNCLTCNQCHRQLYGEFYQDTTKDNSFVCAPCAQGVTKNSSQDTSNSNPRNSRSQWRKSASRSQLLQNDPQRQRSSSKISKPTQMFEKPNCPQCNRPITGENMMAFGKVWHTHCLTCSRCSTQLNGECFEDQGGKVMCGRCHGMKTCSSCKKEITGQFLNFPDSGENFHIDCLPQHSCHTCKLPIKGTGITSALDKHWHQNCFSCFNCGKHLDRDYFSKGNEPWCETCINTQTCFTCHNPLSGAYIPYKGKNYHAQCFSCSKCSRALDTSEFYDINQFPFCRKCAVQYTG